MTKTGNSFGPGIFSRWDRQVLILTLLSTFLGLVIVFDAAYPKAFDKGRLIPPEVMSQAFAAVFAILGGWLFSRIPSKVLRRGAIGFFAVIFLAVVAVEFVGTYQNGAKRWLDLKVYLWQPAETFKMATILFLAAVLADRPKWPSRVPKFKDPIKQIEVVHWSRFKRLLPGILVFIGIGFIEHEPDLGTAAVVLCIAVAMFIFGRVSRRSLATVGIICVAGLGLLVFKEGYRVQRFESHNHRWDAKVMSNEGFQTVQSEFAMASGHVLGVGVGGGRAKHVMPAAATDFVLATVAEETGFVGVTIILSILGALCWRLVQLAEMVRGEFARLTLLGTAAWITVQTVTNVLMSNGMLPPIGIPIPLVSHGGSSLLSLWLALAVSQAAYACDRKEALKEEAVEPDPHGWRYGRAYLPGT